MFYLYYYYNNNIMNTFNVLHNNFIILYTIVLFIEVILNIMDIFNKK